ncbi:hypothetical protein ACE6ED_28785, partial [Paenibacillus sp. CN-4]|uniref:hypothetical protein n=1 Tax=Paenibacillus nanchangensis TaxID=3348343 RepID=UPI003978789B
ITDLESARQPKSPGISEITSSESGKTSVSRSVVIRCGCVAGEDSFQFVQRQQRQSKIWFIKFWSAAAFINSTFTGRDRQRNLDRQRSLSSADTP